MNINRPLASPERVLGFDDHDTLEPFPRARQRLDDLGVWLDMCFGAATVAPSPFGSRSLGSEWARVLAGTDM